MTHSGRIHNGAIVPDEPLALPEGAAVTFTVLPHSETLSEEARPLSERLAGVLGVTNELPDDAATNLMHYLYGQAKQ